MKCAARCTDFHSIRHGVAPPCPYRGKYFIQGRWLCGHHTRSTDVSMRQRMTHIQKLGASNLTPEEKDRFAVILHATWQAIGSDCEAAVEESGRKMTQDDVIEMVLDANRPMEYGMTLEEYEVLSAVHGRQDTRRWLKKVLNY